MSEMIKFGWDLAAEFTARARRATQGDPAMADFGVLDIVLGTAPGVTLICSEVPSGQHQRGGNLWSPDRPTLIGLLKRSYEHRSRRLDPKTGRILPLPERWGDILMAAFPYRFEHASPDVGPGWCDLILAVCGMLDERKLEASFSQIKEKFGTLRLYNDGGREVMQIEACADYLSAIICEDCGAPGRRRKGGWVRTLCDEHAKGKDGLGEDG